MIRIFLAALLLASVAEAQTPEQSSILANMASTSAQAEKLALGKYQLDLSLGGAASGTIALPNNPGVSVGGGAGGGLLVDLGFGKAGATVDHFHVDFAFTLASLTTGGHSAPALTLSLAPAWLATSTSPLLGAGPALVCTTAPLPGVANRCLFGFSFTSGFAALLATFGFGTP